MDKIPKFSELSHIPGNDKAPGCAWIWGDDDNVGTLNFLTSEVILAAKDEIRVGLSCALNWEMTKNLKFPPRPRCKTELQIIDSSSSGTFAFDDEVSILDFCVFVTSSLNTKIPFRFISTLSQDHRLMA
jgi:hypothetical protein